MSCLDVIRGDIMHSHMLLLILALSVHGEAWPEGSVAGSLGLIRPIRVNGELTTISIPANYIE